jgi:hypothetical protein
MTVLTPLQLTQAGFNKDQIAYWIENQRPILKAAGFTDFEINDAFKIKPKKPILNSLQKIKPLFQMENLN